MSKSIEFWIDILKISYCNRIFRYLWTLSKCGGLKVKARTSREGDDDVVNLMINLMICTSFIYIF